MKLGSNVTVFILFFGVALVEAFGSQDWLRAGLFLGLGLVFLYADNKMKNPIMKKVVIVAVILLLGAGVLVLFNFLREKYCWFGYLSNTCMYRNAPPLPPGMVY